MQPERNGSKVRADKPRPTPRLDRAQPLIAAAWTVQSGAANGGARPASSRSPATAARTAPITLGSSTVAIKRAGARVVHAREGCPHPALSPPEAWRHHLSERHWDRLRYAAEKSITIRETGHDPSATIRQDRPCQQRDPLRRRGARARHPGRGGPRARGAAAPRRQPHRHRGALRRLGAPDRAVDGAPSEGFLPRHQDRLARGQGGARGHPPLARAAARRPRRPDPAPLARPPRRLGPGDGARRGAGGRRTGARAGARARTSA